MLQLTNVEKGSLVIFYFCYLCEEKKKKKNSDYDDMTKKIIKFEITVITLGNIGALLIISVS